MEIQHEQVTSTTTPDEILVGNCPIDFTQKLICQAHLAIHEKIVLHREHGNDDDDVDGLAIVEDYLSPDFIGFSNLEEFNVALTVTLLNYLIKTFRQIRLSSLIDPIEREYILLDKKNYDGVALCAMFDSDAESTNYMTWVSDKVNYVTHYGAWYNNVAKGFIRRYGFLQNGQRIKLHVSEHYHCLLIE